MFGKLINSYLYGKSGKGDYTRGRPAPEPGAAVSGNAARAAERADADQPAVYAQLASGDDHHRIPPDFGLFTALSGMAEANMLFAEGSIIAGGAGSADPDRHGRDPVHRAIFWRCCCSIPAITITGPFTPGLCYVTRNWARDEHAFIFSDFKDAVKENWKQGLLTGFITGLVPMVAYVCWDFYGSLASQNSAVRHPANADAAGRHPVDDEPDLHLSADDQLPAEVRPAAAQFLPAHARAAAADAAV